jgi:formate hydrogenlyase subunit 3/multisubunit Na+/H+ antiporter MnhD subunit
MFENSLLSIIAPIALVLGGILAPVVSKKGKGMLATLSAFFVIAIAVNTWILLNLEGGALYFPTASGIMINSASAFVVELTLILGFLGAIYSSQYFEDETHLGAFYALYSLFLSSLIIMATSFNMLIIYVGFEASTIAGGILILFTRRQSATKAAVRFFIMSVLGAVIILAGILYQNWLTGTYILHVSYYSLAPSAMVTLAAIYAIGFSIKVGIFPFGLLWLPAAHSEAPTPLSAILSGVMVQIAAFAVARIIGAIDPVSDTLAWVILGMGAASVIVGATLALVEATAGSKWSRFHVGQINIRGIKRIWAFSTSSEVGVFYILIGLAILEPTLWYVFFMGILLHFLNHGLAKALLFFDSGFVIESSHVANISFLRGLGSKIGPNGLTYLIGGLSLSLIPGTLGYTTLREFTSSNMPLWITVLVFCAAALIGFTTIYSLWCFVSNKPKVNVTDVNVHNRSLPLLRLPGIVIAICILALGLIITLGANNIIFHDLYLQIEDWFKTAAFTIVYPYISGGL